jgi:hypothetical protein
MPHFEEKKAIIAKRVLERKRQREVEEEVPGVAAPEEGIDYPLDEVLAALIDDEELDVPAEELEDLDLPPLQEVFQEVYAEAYQGYLGGTNFEENPYAIEGMTEDEDNPEFVLQEAWSDGWLSAHTDACIASLVLIAKEMVTSDDDEKVVESFDALSEAVEVLGEVLDYDTLAENWSDIIG